MDKLYIENKTTGKKLTADEFNKIPSKINDLVDAFNTEEERVKTAVRKNPPTLGQLANVNTTADNLTSETCVLVWGGAQWLPMRLAELGIGQGGGGGQTEILYYLRAAGKATLI